MTKAASAERFASQEGNHVAQHKDDWALQLQLPERSSSVDIPHLFFCVNFPLNLNRLTYTRHGELRPYSSGCVV